MDEKKTLMAAEVKPELTEIWEIYARSHKPSDASSTGHEAPGERWQKLSKNHLPTLTETGHRGLGDLTIQGHLGTGGMGVVYQAAQLSMSREVAVKMLRDDKRTDYHSEKLLAEARITASLDHPNIIPIHSLGVDHAGAPLYVMKRVEGVSWKAVLKEGAKIPSLLDTQDDALDAHLGILEQVCRAVHFAHSRGIVHLDLKAGNVMLGNFGEVYVVDWGIAACFDGAACSTQEELPSVQEITQPKGTPGFMAPEMAAAEGEFIGPQTDVYLLGGILHYILTGESRHRGQDIYTILGAAYLSAPFTYGAEVAPRLGEICNKAMARQPVDRFDTAEEMRRAIARFRQQREGTKLVSRAREQLAKLVEESRNPTLMTSQLYRMYGELSFALRRAHELGIPKTEGLQGAALRVMFDFELMHENARAARELLGEARQWGASDARRMAQLEELEKRLSQRDAHIRRLEDTHGENDATVSQRTRGLMLLGMTLCWAGIAATSRVMWRNEILPMTEYTLIGIKVVNTLLAVALILVAPRLMRFNMANRRIFMTLGVAMISGLAVRTICLLHGVHESISLSLESLAALLCVLVLGIFTDRRLLWSSPFFLASVIGTLLIPTRAWELMIVWNMSGLLLLGAIWLRSQRSAAS